MVKFHGFSKRKAVHKSIKPTLAIDFIEQPSHPVSFINQLPYAVLDKNVLWLSISEQDINFPTSLTNELRLFSDYVKLDEQEEEARNILLHDVEITTQSVFPNAYIEAFGSFPVGLSTFLSDLDVTILGVDQPRAQLQGCVEMKDGNCGTAEPRADRDNKRSSEDTGVKMGSDVSVKFRDEDDRVMRLIYLEQVYTAIQSCSWAHKTDLWRRARVPIIHLTHRNSVQCDVCINMPQHSTVVVVRGLQERSGPALFVLSAFLKIFLKQLSLDMPFTGGLGSYKLYVLIAKHIERHPEHVADKLAPRLGELLLSFLEFYGDRRNLHADVVVEMAGAETVSFERTSKVHEIRMAFEKAHSVLRGAEHRRQQRLLSGKEDAAAALAGNRRPSGSMLAGLLNAAHLARLRNQLRARCHRYLSHRAVSCSAGKSHSSLGEGEGVCVDREEGEVSEDSSYEDRAEGAAADQEHQLAVLKARLRDRIGKLKRGRSSPMRLSASDGTACAEGAYMGAHMGGCSSGGGSGSGSSDDELSGDSDTDGNSTEGSWALHGDSESGQGGDREEGEVSEYSEEGGEESEEDEGGYEAEPVEINIASSSVADQERQLALLKARLRDRLGQSKNSQGQAALVNSDLPLPESNGVVGAEKDASSDGSPDISDDEHSDESGTDRAAWALRGTGGWAGGQEVIDLT